jgi:cysteamine dioxygenase
MRSCSCIEAHRRLVFFFLLAAANGTGDLASSMERDQGRLTWLKEIDMPRELKMCSVHYGGPPISDK